MKRFSKTVVILLALLMSLSICVFGAGCEDIKTLNVKVSVYDIDNSKFTEKEFEIELYRHLAPETVDAIIGYVKEGYYNDAIFYVDKNYDNQIMLGDLTYNNGTVTQKESKSQVIGEFDLAGVKGSDLTNTLGSVGLWRSFRAKGSYANSTCLDTGRQTIYFPLSDISSYNGNFCVFGKFDEDDEVFNMIQNVFDNSDYYESYMIFYSGEYDKDDSVKNNGLTFNCIKKADYDVLDDGDKDALNIFNPEEYEGNAYAEYKIHEVLIPVYNNQLSAVIKSIEVK